MLYLYVVTILSGGLLGLIAGRLLITTALPFSYPLIGTFARFILFTGAFFFLLRWQAINPILFVVSYILCFWMRAFIRLLQ